MNEKAASKMQNIKTQSPFYNKSMHRPSFSFNFHIILFVHNASHKQREKRQL